jgi:hypothetical protein
MAGIEYGLGRFGDRRLEKGGPLCMRRWWRGRVRAFAGSREHGHGRFSSRACCATLL